jgi:thioredoxin type arsenate reductase
MVLLAERTATQFTNPKLGGEITMSEWEQDAIVLRANHPQHILFLCVANSARSQIAEGIARSLASAEVKISSAGSVPTKIKPEVVQVLREIGIDASSQYSKGMDAVDLDSVEVVVTLCADEVCPVFLRPILRLHWGFPDPASVKGSDEERLQAFRDVRDELAKRLKLVFK